MMGHPETHATNWEGIPLQITWNPTWVALPHLDFATAHLEVRSDTREPLPITETGYRSHFLPRETVEAYGGPVEYTATPPRLDANERMAAAENFLSHVRAEVRHGGNRAYYAPHPDYIQMPPFEFFRDPESYYATLLHEATHWTAHKSRLDRDFGRKRWGDEGYAMEELVAEIGSAFLPADLDVTPKVRDDHAAYIVSWIKVLKDDKRAIFTAAGHAQRAAAFLHERQPQPEPEPDDAQATCTVAPEEGPSLS